MRSNETIASSFLQQARKFPGSTAVEFNGKKLTYEELDNKSSQLARFLRGKGINVNSLVPICINRSLEMIIGILGIIKAGGSYVPIDPQYPQERKNHIIQDTCAALLISNKQSAKDLPGELILLDTDWNLISEPSIDAAPSALTHDDLAYLIYTSGSTGKPKGVMVPHKSLLAYIRRQSAYLGINSTERILQFSNFAFDASIEQIFLALLNGASLVLISEDLLQDAEAFSAFIKAQRVTHLHATPGFLENLVPDEFPYLKRIVAAGDICSKQLASRWLGKVDFYNKYGPTEATISVIEYLCPASGIDNIQSLPIGKALPGVGVYLIDADLNQIKVPGQLGEIWVAGDQVARGYLNQPELTAEKFISSPFVAGEIVYKTGDICSYSEDGNLQFHGRQDDQVKIRGYRIEPAEIENVLSTAPSVRQAAVIAHNTAGVGMQLFGYVVVNGVFDRDLIEAFLTSKLPTYMLPQQLIALDAIPLTPNGKADRKGLPLPKASRLPLDGYVAPQGTIEKQLASIWQSVLNINNIGTQDNFFHLGGNSLLAQKLVTQLKLLGLRLPVAKLYSSPTISQIARYLDGKEAMQIALRKSRGDTYVEDSDVAVVGMAGRFPGSNTVFEFWENLKNGTESISFFTADELDPSIPDSVKSSPDYVRARGIIENAAAFDPTFFGINPKLAELMDPQQRIFLEICWEALEMSGNIPGKYPGIIGVFAGCRFNTYYSNNVLTNKALIDNVGAFQVGTVSDKDYIATRVAYALDLKGPAVNVQSACSTSLLAVAQAVESIRKGQCEVALAGAASVLVPVKSGHLYEEGAILSRDGHCRTFDVEATGTLFSDGAGVVVLKNRKLAEKDGDTIFAVIKGVGLSNDGASKSSFTAPSAAGQAAAIRMALEDANVKPAQISYIEAHGTATPIGDPIEIEGLNLAFGEQHARQYCALGSLKSNFGHLTAASGVAGLIKTCLALYFRQIPPSINFTKPNPHIDFQNSPFYVNGTLSDWNSNGTRLAGVSSFGVGGTNVHLVVEEAQETVPASADSRPLQLLCWSAKDQSSLDNYNRRLSDFLNSNRELDLADVAYTLHTNRQDFNLRRFCVAPTGDAFLEYSSAPAPFKNSSKKIAGRHPKVVFMFPGQGSQFVGMANELYQQEMVFKTAIDECAELLLHEMGENILKVIYPTHVDDAADKRLQETEYSQPALFSIGYALTKLWMSWGIKPAAFIGHSIGEFVAAHFAGVFSLPDAIKLIAARGKLMSELPGGSMLSVRGSMEDIGPLLSPDISLAAVNSPNLFVLAGSTGDIASISEQLESKSIVSRLLSTSHAFHSHMMDAIIDPFESIVKAVKLSAPVIPIMSTVTGNWMQAAEATNPAYWATHLRSTVQFGKAAKALIDASYFIFLEVGPGNTCATLTRQQAANSPIVAVSSLGTSATGTSAYAQVLNALGELWLNGLEPDWRSFYQGQQRAKVIQLPTYAFNNKNYWVEPLATRPAVSNLIIHEETRITDHIHKFLPMRKHILVNKLRNILENASGIDLVNAAPDTSFMEIGLDSLLLTQVSLTLKKEFSQPITFRQLNEEYSNLDALAGYLDKVLPEDVPAAAPQEHKSTTALNGHAFYAAPAIAMNGQPANSAAIDLISQQLQLLARQLSLLQGLPMEQVPQTSQLQPAVEPIKPVPASSASVELSPEEEREIKKPFGASARIEKQSAALNDIQQNYLQDLIARYNAKTNKSKEYTAEHRAYMADPRVVSGFKPATKELVYSLVVNKSKGSRLWDLDGNEYIDALNGFGSNMLGYQPDFLTKALIEQIEKGYEIGPQHELAGEVSSLIAEFTQFDRVALCNTGSEAVLGAMRIARTSTGRSLIVAFTGSYHGIADEVIVRGSKKLRTYPAAPGIMPEVVQNMLILDYGTDETLRIIEERASEIAAVLVEPVQSRRADFKPIAFLKKLRKITEAAESVLIFDEVISGFRFHPGGVQAMFGIRADIGTYGKVAGGGISIGIIAGKKKYMDALDGGTWQYGDDSIPEVGVTYFAGTFVRHPLALAASKASLLYLKEAGPQLQEKLNANGLYIANAINGLCRRLHVPMFIAQFGSLWRIKFIEEYPYAELFFTLMRLKGIHILEGFACFLTTAHSSADIEQIIQCFEESLVELKGVGLIPHYEHPASENNSSAGLHVLPEIPVPNARLGKDKAGNPAWFVEDEQNPGKYLQINLDTV